MLPSFFWNIVGTASLGFSAFVLTVNLAGFLNVVVRDLMQTDQVWTVLADSYLAPYGFFLIVVSYIVCYIIIKRAITHNVMGYLQLSIVVATASMLALWISLYPDTSPACCLAALPDMAR